MEELYYNLTKLYPWNTKTNTQKDRKASLIYLNLIQSLFLIMYKSEEF